MGTEQVKARFETMRPFLDERMRRLFAASEAIAIGRRGVSIVLRAMSAFRRAIAIGCKELTQPPLQSTKIRIRKVGGGRKRTTDTAPTLVSDLEVLIESATRGDPESPLRWTCKSGRNLAQELRHLEHQVSHRMVVELLHTLGYSLQAHCKTLEEGDHPDCNAQFEHIHDKVIEWRSTGQPVISVDIKKKELVDDCKNAGREWYPQGQPEEMRVHDFIIPEMGCASPYGVYDVTRNVGWVNGGIDHDTSSFAVESVRRLWNLM